MALFALTDAAAPHVPDLGHAGQLAFLILVSIPLTTLVVYALGGGDPGPQRLIAAIAGCTAVAAVSIELGYPGTPATAAKLTAAACIGMGLAGMLRSMTELVGIALLVALVDAYSVAAGPTHEIVAHHPGVLDDLALNLRVLGTYGVVQIGVSDFIFFALFTAAAARLALHRRLGWAAMTASFGTTILLADHYTLALPALPLLSAAFLAANAGVLLAHRRGRSVPPKGRDA
jgi:hypothetical protein